LKMQTVWKIILVISIVINLVAVWGFFHYMRYGGSPLGDLKRLLSGRTKQQSPAIPFAEENAVLLDRLAAGETDSLRVVFLGASITNRWNLKKYFPEIHPVNRSIGGQLVPGMLPRFKRDVIDLKPKAVVIKFCSINFRPEMPLSILEDGMTMMVQLSKANGIIPVISTVIPVGRPEARIGDFSVADSLSKFNDWVRRYAQEDSVPMIDYAAAIQDQHGFLPRQCSVDAVHLNDKGYEIISAAARPVVYRVMGID
jgi:hypothetical protein